MTTRCLICDSTVVLHKEATRTMILLIGAVDGFLRGVQQRRTHGLATHSETEHESQPSQLLTLILEGASEAASGRDDRIAFAQDVEKYQFGGYDYLCLRCGARFDEQPTD